MVLAGVCEKSISYHVYPEYSYVELIEGDDELLSYENDTIYEIVGTSFGNNAMPLIRYRTMDYAVEDSIKCKCKRNYPLLKKVIGRKQDFFIDKTGCLITFTGMNRPLRPVTQKIMAYQYIQEKEGIVKLNIELKEKFNTDDILTIKKIFQSIYPRFDIEIDFVDYIHRTKNGKFRYLVQKINFG